MEFHFLRRIMPRRGIRFTRRNLIIGGAVIVAVLLIGATAAYLLLREPAPPEGSILLDTGEYGEYQPREASGETLDTAFTCPDGEEFTTSYDFGSNEITLTLPDGSQHVLLQSFSGDSARYQKQDGSVLFVEENGSARVEQNGTTVHEECTPVIGGTPAA